jgi:hypothetical protein
MNQIEKDKMIKVIESFYEIESIRGTNAKKEYLNRLKDNQNFTNTIKWFFSNNPTGIAARKLKKDCAGLGKYIETFDDFFSYIDNNCTGRDEDVGTVQKLAEEFRPKIAEGIYRLAQKKWDKGLGIEATTVNDVYGDNFIPIFKIQLCSTYWDNEDYWEDKTFAISPKCVSGDTIIYTIEGEKSIKEIVDLKIKTKILGFNENEDSIDFGDIENWIKIKKDLKKKWFKIKTKSGKILKITSNDRIKMENGSYRKIEDLIIGDSICIK